MRAVIIGNGDISDYAYIKTKLFDDDYFICADGGSRHIEKLGICADVAIGDFDSSTESDDVKSYVYPSEKDFTDGELAVTYAIENGYDEILLIGMTGSRLDHTFTNIFQLFKGEKISLLDDKNEIFALKDTLVINNKKGSTLSVVPVFSDLLGVSSEGLYYPMHNETLYFGKGRGNSNIITDDVCTISVKEGMGLVFINNGE